MKSHLARKRATERSRVRLRIESLEERSNPALVTPAPIPTPANNDFTRIQDAINTALDGDTITLTGTFDFTEANAAASWALGSDGTAGTFDDYSVYVPEGLTGLTITATALGTGTIQGPGDLPELDLESFLYFDGLDYQGTTVSNLEILDFDLAVGMFTVDEFNGTFDDVTVTNNRIRIATDLNGIANPNDTLHNIGVHYAFGKNQTISDNQFEIPGDGVSSSSATDGDLFANPQKFSSSVAIQSRNAAGDLVDGLTISGNIITVLNAQSAFPERIVGVWENTTANLSNISVFNNQFLNNSPDNDPGVNRQQAFWVTSHSNSAGLGTTVSYSDNTVSGAALGFRYTSDYDYGLDPNNIAIEFVNNTLTDVSAGFLIQNNGKAHLTGNVLTGVGVGPGAGIGVYLKAGSTLDFDAVVAANEVSGFATGLQLSGSARVDGATITNNATGILAIGGLTMIQNTDLQNNTAVGLQVRDGAIVDAGQIATIAYTPVDFTGLGISAGGNSFLSGYSAGGALAIVNLNTGTNYNTLGPNGIPFDLTAHGSIFGDLSASFIETVIRHDFDDPLLGYIDIASAVSFADLAVTAEFVTAPAFVDQRLTLYVKVTNFGPSAAAGVILDSDVPAGSTFVSVATSQGTASQLAGTVTANLGSIPSGGSAIVRIVVVPTGIGLLTSTSDVTATLLPADPNLLNNTAVATVNVSNTPGGIVKVARSSGKLTYTGDAAENAIQIVAGPGPGSLTVIGLGGTLIKFGGVTGPTATINNILAGIGGSLAGGNDTIIIDGSGTNNRLAVIGSIGGNISNGNDVMYALHLEATGGFIATGGAGVNRVEVTESTFGRGFVFNGGSGNDILEVSETAVARGFVARGGNDADQFEITKTTVGQGFIWNGGAGDDFLSVSELVAGRAATLYGLGGLDSVTIAGSTFGKPFTWNGGAGNDNLSISDTTFNHTFKAVGAAGDDTIVALRTAFNANARFDGGGGVFVDTLSVGSLSLPVGSAQANTFAQTPVVVGFELILT